MSPLRVRLASGDDGEALARIYGPLVRETAVSFEEVPPTAEVMAQRVLATLPAHPWLVTERDAQVLGYAYAGPHRKRAAYAWSVETSVYLAEQARGQKLGSRLYTILLGILREQGFAAVYGGITLPNEASVALHRRFGFRDVGIYRRVGFKGGQWHDVWWGELDLMPQRDAQPEVPRSVDELDIVRLIAELDPDHHG